MTPDQIEIDIERTREDLRQNVDALKDKLSPTHAAKRSAARLGESVSQARDTLMGTAEDSVAKTQESLTGVSDKISTGARGNPVAVGLGAFALGWLVSSLIPATKTEKDAAGNLRDSDMAASMVQPLADTARTMAENAGDNAKEAAQEVGREAQTAATTVTENIAPNGHNPTTSGTL
jgi:hypothetical protein